MEQHCQSKLLTGLSGVSRCWAAINRMVAKIGSGFAVFSSSAILIMMVIGGMDVIMTKLFNSPVPMTVELTETLLVALVFGGLAHAQSHRQHVRIEMLVMKMSPTIRSFF